MKIYNLVGYLIILAYTLGCAYFAPTHLGLWAALLMGGVYFVFCWFLGGLYLADVLHLGIAHRSLEFRGSRNPRTSGKGNVGGNRRL